MERILHQLRLLVYPIICRILYIPGGLPDFWKSTVGSSKDLLFCALGHPATDCDMYFLHLDHCPLAQQRAINPLLQTGRQKIGGINSFFFFWGGVETVIGLEHVVFGSCAC